MTQAGHPEWTPRADAGRLLKLMRVAAERRVDEVAAGAGISHSHLSNLEACRHRLLPEVAERLVREILRGQVVRVRPRA
jgi:hypothetical protein